MNRKLFITRGLATSAAVSMNTLSARPAAETLSSITDTALPAKILAPSDGLHHKVLGTDIRIKLTGEDTYGQLMLMEDSLQPGSGIPLHVHTREDEIFRVLKGQVEYTLGETSRILYPGEVAFAPRNLPHAWKVAGEEPASTLTIATPSGLEHMFAELGQLPPGPPDFPRVAEICGRYGIRFL